MSKTFSSQIEYENGVSVEEALQQLLDPANEYEHPATHPVSMITGALSEAQITDKINLAISGLINGAPGALDTLNELSTALGNDANYAATMSALVARKTESKIIEATFPANSTTLTVNDAFVVEATCMVEISPQGPTIGSLTGTFVNGVITVTSDKTETIAVPLLIEVRKSGTLT